MALKTDWKAGEKGLTGAVNDAATAVNDHETQLATRLSEAGLNATIDSIAGPAGAAAAFEAIANDPGVAQAAASLAQSDAGLVRGSVASASESDDSVLALTSKSGKLLYGVRGDGLASKGTSDKFDPYFQRYQEAPKIPGIHTALRTLSGKVPVFIDDLGRLNAPGGFVGPGQGGESGNELYTETVDGVDYLINITTGERRRVITDRTRLLTNGSSTFAGMAAQFSGFAVAHGATLVDTATAGVGAEHTLAKLGSRPLLVSAATEIAGAVPTSVSSSNVPSSIYNAWSAHGHFEGHPEAPGTISKASGGGAASWTFTRDAAGVVFTVAAGTPFIPDATAFRDAIMILNVGKNNGAGTTVGGVTTSVAQIIQWTHDAYEWATSTGKTVYVVGHFHDTGTPLDSARRVWFDTYNAEMAGYGLRYGDFAGYVGSERIYADLGITPTTADEAEIAIGNKGPSISTDALHLTVAARTAVMENLFAPALTETLNWMLEEA